MSRASAARAVWTAESIACLLELRLGLLLPRFSRSRAPAQLQDAWKQLQDEFALETGADVSVSQLKNKYQQLKREYEETRRRLARRRVGEDAANGDADDSSSNADADAAGAAGVATDNDDEDDDPTLPLYWPIVKAAFSSADGRDGVSFFRRPRKKSDARLRSDAGSDGALHETQAGSGSAEAVAAPATESEDEMPVPRRSSSSSSANTASPTPAAGGGSAVPRMVTSDAATPARDSAAGSQIVTSRRPSSPSAQQPPRIVTSSASNSNSSSSNNNTSGNTSNGHISSSTSSSRNAHQAEASERPRLSGVKRPLLRENQPPAPPTEGSDNPPATTTTAAIARVARASGDLDIAQAIVAAGERIASAMLESARIIAGAPPAASSSSLSSTSPSPSTEAARYADIAAKQDAQERMLEALAQSAKSSEQLLRTLAESALRRQERRS